MERYGSLQVPTPATNPAPVPEAANGVHHIRGGQPPALHEDRTAGRRWEA